MPASPISRREAILRCGWTAAGIGLSLPFIHWKTIETMHPNTSTDVIIIGGSYAGLSAAMALGRALRHVLIIDSGLPCNRQTPHSHNFLTQDGEKPRHIAAIAQMQVNAYSTVTRINGLAVHGSKTAEGFRITTENGETYTSRKLILATGLTDIMPGLEGFADCWGVSILHCPYCHGYEVRQRRTGILADGDTAVHYSRLLQQWTNDLVILTNGASTLTEDKKQLIARHKIRLIEKEIVRLVHTEGQLQQILFRDGTSEYLTAAYSRPATYQHCIIPQQLGCELTEQGLIKVSMMQNTSIAGVYACGDCCSPIRSVAWSVATGSMAGSAVNNEMTEEDWAAV